MLIFITEYARQINEKLIIHSKAQQLHYVKSVIADFLDTIKPRLHFSNHGAIARQLNKIIDFADDQVEDFDLENAAQALLKLFPDQLSMRNKLLFVAGAETPVLYQDYGNDNGSLKANAPLSLTKIIDTILNLDNTKFSNSEYDVETSMPVIAAAELMGKVELFPRIGELPCKKRPLPKCSKPNLKLITNTLPMLCIFILQTISAVKAYDYGIVNDEWYLKTAKIGDVADTALLYLIQHGTQQVSYLPMVNDTAYKTISHVLIADYAFSHLAQVGNLSDDGKLIAPFLSLNLNMYYYNTLLKNWPDISYQELTIKMLAKIAISNDVCELVCNILPFAIVYVANAAKLKLSPENETFVAKINGSEQKMAIAG